MFKSLTLLFVALFLGNCLFSQVDTLVRFTPNFKFKDGIYFSLEEFKANCPKLKASEVVNKRGQQALGLWTQHKKLFYKDNDSLVYLPLDDIWGFSEKGKVYLVKDGRQKRLQIIGSMCHIILVENVEEISENYYGRNRYNARSITREVNREYLIDFEKGEMVEFSMENFLDILIRDDELYQSFDKLDSKRIRNQMKFHFLTKFNDKRPIYLSVSRCEKM
ncbi:MAG: hypothetical protein ACI8XB_001075 [Patiriisocius sp.]|jgi:hypothetical protein